MVEQTDRRRRLPLRTAVVRRVLSEALVDQAARLGRSSLDVVDVGGGTGGFAVPLAQAGHRIVVVDPSPDALAALERRAAEVGVTDLVRAVQGDAAGLADVVPAGAADVVLCHGVLEMVDDPAAALSAVAALLRADSGQGGGLLSLLVAQRQAVVLARALAGQLAEARHALADPDGRWGPTDPVRRRFTREQVVDLVSQAGFTVGASHGVRVVSDLVPPALVDTEPGAAAALLALEEEVCELPDFVALAAALHLLATRSKA